MTLFFRPYRSEYDYYRIREFLSQTLLLHDRRQINWAPYRWDYWRWHTNENILHLKLSEVVNLWETDDRELIGVLNLVKPDEVFLQIHPRYRTPHLVREMLERAEWVYSPKHSLGHMLHVWAYDGDEVLIEALGERGYQKTSHFEYQYRQMLNTPVQELSTPQGFKIRPILGDSELPAQSWAFFKAFQPEQPEDQYKGWQWYRSVQRIPAYRQEFDLVAVTPEGEIASFATVWYDESTRTGAFEPVGAVPIYCGKGLVEALIVEGLRRLQQAGAVVAYANGSAYDAHTIPASTGFTQFDRSELWVETV